MATTKPWYTSKTLWFNVITAAVAIVGTLTNTFTFSGKTAEIFTAILAGGNFLLRFLTSTALTA